MKRAAATIVLAGLSVSASAQNIVGPAFSIVATNDTGTSTFTVDPNTDGLAIPGQGMYLWSFAQFVPGGIIELRDDVTNDLVAVLTNGVVAIQDGSTGENPVIGMAFAVISGSTDTTFRIESGLVDVPDFDQPIARTSAGLTLTDADGDGSASLTGDLASGLAFEAVASGSLFGALHSGLAVNSTNGSAAIDLDFPNGDGIFGPIGAPLTTMNTAFEFTVSAFDTASGTSTFGAINIPAPGAAFLLTLGGIVASRRR